MIILIDNYDSFTYNLYQYILELGADVFVVKNDDRSAREIVKLHPEGIIISPGSGTPKDAGISGELVKRCGPDIPVLGVCLGHEVIGAVHGANIIHAQEVMHGKTSMIHHRGAGVFSGILSPCKVARYHSLVIDQNSLPACLEVTAWTDDGGKQSEIMGIRHRFYPLEGVQFHPEAIQSEFGHALLKNFLKICVKW